MANTTWKQVVYDVADGIRTLLGTSSTIPVGELKGKLTSINRQGDINITPGTSDQNIPGNTYLYGGGVTISGDNNLLPENIKKGISIFGIEGSVEEGGEVLNGELLEDYALNTTIKPNTFVSYSESSDATYGATTTIYDTQKYGNYYRIVKVPNTNYTVGLYNDGSYWYLYTTKVESQTVTKIQALSTGLEYWYPMDVVALDNGKVMAFYVDSENWYLIIKAYTISTTGTLTLSKTIKSEMNYEFSNSLNDTLKCLALTNNKFILVGDGRNSSSDATYMYFKAINITDDYTLTMGESVTTYWTCWYDIDKIDSNKIIYIDESYRNSDNYHDVYACIVTVTDALVVTVGTLLKITSNTSSGALSAYTYPMTVKVLSPTIAVFNYTLNSTYYLQTIKINSSSLSKVSSTTHSLKYATMSVFYENYIILSGYSTYTGNYCYINSIGYRISDSGSISSGGVSIQITDPYYKIISHRPLASVYVGNTVLVIHNMCPKDSYVYPIAQCFGSYSKGLIPATSSILGISKTTATTTAKGQYWVLD